MQNQPSYMRVQEKNTGKEKVCLLDLNRPLAPPIIPIPAASQEAISKMHLTPDGGVAGLSKCSHTAVVAALSNRPAPGPQA
jgi:hypothetical protein